MTASFPTSVKSFSTNVDDTTVVNADYMDQRDQEIVAVETALYGNLTTASPTTSNLTATLVGKGISVHMLDISGLTASRNFVLPAGVTGSVIKVCITTGDDTYALIIIGDSGITINGGSAATEWSRLFIAGEFVELTATSATNWQITGDGRIPCKGVMTRTGSHGNTTHSAGTDVVPDWNAIELDAGNCADLTNDRFNIRRAGYYAATGSWSPAASVTDQRYAAVMIFQNTTKKAAAGLRQSAASPSSLMLAAVFRMPLLCATGDYLQYKFQTEDANIGLGRTDNTTAVLERITFFAFEEILH